MSEAVVWTVVGKGGGVRGSPRSQRASGREKGDSNIITYHFEL